MFSQSVDDRYLSAERARGRWKSAGAGAGLSSIPSGLTSSEDDEAEADFLQASMTSRWGEKHISEHTCPSAALNN